MSRKAGFIPFFGSYPPASIMPSAERWRVSASERVVKNQAFFPLYSSGHLLQYLGKKALHERREHEEEKKNIQAGPPRPYCGKPVCADPFQMGHGGGAAIPEQGKEEFSSPPVDRGIALSLRRHLSLCTEGGLQEMA